VRDMFASSCKARPCGREIKPGVWVDEGAHVHKQARILPPAYVGRDTKIAAASLVTRASSVERDCTVNVGTVIEDSSILAGTYIGSGLDVSHSVVYGKTLIHLQRDLELEIYDEMLIAENLPSRLRKTFKRPGLELVKDLATATKFTHLKGVL
jgi:NDP-sugar pyrophosphorylase family protein